MEKNLTDNTFHNMLAGVEPKADGPAMKTYLVGGAVRDMLMGVACNDRDYVVVGVTPSQMLEYGFEQVGASFPVFLHPETHDEYALARTERKVGTGHTAFECVFDPTVTIEDDLVRRDLTINAIAYDEYTKQFVDPFNGARDMSLKVLRHVSDAFAEDPLRVVRLARFYARFSDFTIHADTVDLARKIVDSGEMNTLSYERYWGELIKVFKEDRLGVVRFFEALDSFGVLDNVQFFKDVFGDDSAIDRVYTIGKFLLINTPDVELRMAVFIAAVSHREARGHKTVPVRVRVLTKLVKQVFGFMFAISAEKVFHVIASTRSFNGPTPASDDLKVALASMANVGYQVGPEVSAIGHVLLKAETACASIKGESFAPLEGKALGEAIAAARLKTIKGIMNES